MREQQFTLAGQAGARLHARYWWPDGEPHSVAVITHGLAEHCGRYGELVAHLTNAGYAVYALDHRGHGRSSGGRANIDRFEYVLADVDTLFARACADWPGRPITLIGHSMGGAIAFAYACRHQDALHALVLSAPLLGMNPNVPKAQELVARLLSKIAPGLGVLKLPADTISRDPDVVRAYLQDPLVHSGAIPARTLVELVAAVGGFAALAPTLRLPVLVLHGTGDSLVPLAFTTPIVEKIGSADKTVRHYDGLYHEVFNEPERARVFADLLDWLAQHRTAARPAA
jgi:alpha-beta hydrolase superfamily lysophospholipase